jgi:hypothetical protein
MSAARLPQVDDVIYTVAQWKDDLDPDSPWWRRWFYKLVYRPFNEFSLKVMKIPPITNVVIEGNKVRFERFEIQGHFSSEHEADISCLTERWSYKDYPFGRLMPPEGGQYGDGPVFPRSTTPRKRTEPIFEYVIKDRRKDERERRTLAECLHELNQQLDQR